MKDNDPGKDGTVTAYLMDMASASATSGTQIAQAAIPLTAWPANFAEQTLDFGIVNHIVAAGRYLAVKVVVGNSSDDDLWFAYDATAYPSRLQIGSVNNAPAANDVSASGSEDAAQIAITLTGSDLEGPLASFRLIGLPGNGLLYIDPGLTTLAAVATDYAATGNARTFYFVPTGNWNGTTSFQFTAVDGGGLSDATAANATINVAAVNDAPAANDVSASGNEDDAQIAITLTGSDVEGPLASFRLIGLPANGLLYLDAGLTTLAASGINYAATGNARTFYFVPTANWNGATSFQFTAVDGAGLADTTPADATITVAAVNDAPVANTASASGNEDDAQIAITLTGSDVEGPVASFRLAGLPANGLLYINAGLTTLAASGTNYAATSNARTFYFVPAANWRGTTSFQFTAVDGSGLADATPANATITVAGVNDAPAGTDGAVATLMNTPRVLTAADFGFSDPDAGDSMNAVRIDSLPLLGTLSIGGIPLLVAGAVVSAGQLAAGDLVFTPVPLTSGTPYANFDFSVADAASVFDPTPNVLTINVLFVNSPPDGTTTSVTTNEDVPHAFTVANFGFTDPDAGDSLSAVRIDTLPAAGTLTLNAVALSAGQVILVADINAGLLRFTPAPDASGAGYASFTFSVRDTAGPAFDPAPNTMTINVTAVNDAPAANDVSASGNEDAAQIAITLTGSDLEGPLASFRLIGLPGNGLLYIDPGLTTLAAVATDYAAAGNARTFYFVPTANWNGTTGFQFTAVDGGGLSDATAANATINVAAVNDAPAANDVTASGNEDDAQIAITLTGSDVEGPLASFRLIGLPANGLLYLDAGLTTLAASGINYAATGNARTFYFVPTANWNGATSFQFTAVDGAGLADTTPADATITVAAVNDAPVNSVPGPQSVNEDSPLALNTIAVSDAENNVTSVVLSVLNGTLAATPAGGAAVAGGGTPSVTITGAQSGISLTLASLVYQGDLGFSGTDTLTMTSTDAGSLQDVDPVTINVLPVNDAPVAADNAYAVSEDATLSVPLASAGVLVNDTDVDGPALSAALVAGPANGVLALAANGTFTYTPNADFYGTDTFTYRAFDGSASSNVAAVTITVNNVADHTLVVDTAADIVNGDTSSIDALLANKGVDGLVSLREAILAANATANAGTPDLIYFSIAGSGPHTIAVSGTLPQITDAVVIDGTTEPDFVGTPVIVLDGNSGAGNGLRLASNGSTVRGLAIVDFGQVGILVSGTGNTIAGNYIGIAADGVTAAGNQTYGVRVNAGGNVIGGTTAAQRNVISGNRIDGLYIAGGSGNVVQGNYVGTNAAGTAAVANLEDGIWIDGASNTTIGGIAVGQGNLLSGNLWSGIALSGSGTGNVVVRQPDRRECSRDGGDRQPTARRRSRFVQRLHGRRHRRRGSERDRLQWDRRRLSRRRHGPLDPRQLDLRERRPRHRSPPRGQLGHERPRDLQRDGQRRHRNHRGRGATGCDGRVLRSRPRSQRARRGSNAPRQRRGLRSGARSGRPDRAAVLVHFRHRFDGRRRQADRHRDRRRRQHFRIRAQRGRECAAARNRDHADRRPYHDRRRRDRAVLGAAPKRARVQRDDRVFDERCDRGHGRAGIAHVHRAELERPAVCHRDRRRGFPDRRHGGVHTAGRSGDKPGSRLQRPRPCRHRAHQRRRRERRASQLGARCTEHPGGHRAGVRRTARLLDRRP